MTTLSTSVLNDIAWHWDTSCGLPSAVLSGIVGDLAHAASGGYHISIEDQVNPDNYSIRLQKDKAPPGTWARNRASAIDMSMNPTDMATMWWRFHNVFVNRANDPRAQYIREAIGLNPTNGRAMRMDFATGSITYASSDHEWHWHESLYRMYANDPAMVPAVKSVHLGQSLRDYLGPAPQPEEEDEDNMQRLYWKKGEAVWAIVGAAPGTTGNCYIIGTQEEADSTLLGFKQPVSIKVLPENWDDFVERMRAPLKYVEAPEVPV
jgi:hypothetical protein